VTYEPLSKEELDQNSAKSGLVVTVTSKPGLPLGPIRQKILLQTNVEDHNELQLPLQGNVTSDISVIGPDWSGTTGALRMGLIKSNQGATKTLKLVTRGPHRGDITFEVESKNPDFLKVEIGERTEFAGGSVTQVPITISVPKGLPPVNHSGTRLGKLAEIQIKTNHPDVPHVPVRVQFVIQDD
jgi:hypothetical protein